MASFMKKKEDFWSNLLDLFWFCIYFSFLLAHLKTWEISNANSPNKKKLCFGALARPIKGKHIKFTRHSAVDGTCAAPMKAKRKQIGGWKENYEIKGQIYGTTFSCQQALNCTHYCHCVALSIPKHCDLLEAWFANSTTWTHFSQYHKSTDFISGTNALSSRNAYALCTSYETVKVFLSPSGDLGIGLVWHNRTGPHFGLTVEILFKVN